MIKPMKMFLRKKVDHEMKVSPNTTLNEKWFEQLKIYEDVIKILDQDAQDKYLNKNLNF